MNVLVAAVGKAKSNAPESQLFAEYTKRLTWKLTLKEIDGKLADKRKEGAALLEACKGYERIIALDERGRDMSSRELALSISAWQQQGISSVAFVIGGADGHDDLLRKNAHMLLSFGKATWPHMLVRSMLAEQIYRAQTILDGHPYHRD